MAMASPKKIERTIMYLKESNILNDDHSDHDDVKELRLMLLGCEDSDIYGPNENIAVSLFVSSIHILM
jgi:hypothetical protein